MSGGLIDIIRLVIDLYATVILVRLLLQLVQADFFNPISQTIFKITAPIVEPLHKICLLYTSPSPRDRTRSRMPSSA